MQLIMALTLIFIPIHWKQQFKPLVMALIFMFVNIRSLAEHKLLFDHLLMEEKVTAFLLNETHLKPTQRCHFSSYALLRKDSPYPMQRANGGVAIGFSPKLPYRTHSLSTLAAPEYLITTLYYKSLYVTLATIYVRPGHPIPLQFFEFISNRFRHFVIMADINIHSRSTRDKDAFHTFITTRTTGTLHHLPKHTRPESGTTPDIVITSVNLTQRCTIHVLDPVGSDHLPIKLTITSPNHRNLPAQAPSRTTWRFDRADWHKYRDSLNTSFQDFMAPTTEQELYTAVDHITTSLQQASHDCIPQTTSVPYRPKLPPDYLPLIRRSRQCYRDYTLTGNRASLHHHRQLQRTVRNYLKAFRLRQWIKTCNTLSTTAHPSQYWRRFKALTGQSKSTSYPLLVNDIPLHTDQEKADAFADQLQSTFTPTVPQGLSPRHPVNRFNFTSRLLQPDITHSLDLDNPLTEPITTDDIIHTVSRKRNTAPGIDQITYRHIKESPYILIRLLATIYTFILRTGFIPSTWKTSKTLLFAKPDKPPDAVTSYRPIQLTSVFSKILERILVRRLHHHLTDFNLLPLQQAGFRPSFSINDQLLRLTNIVTNHFSTAQPSCLLLFDLEKAFDKVWHHGLISKLRNFRLPLPLIRFIFHFLANRLTYVSINNHLSHPVFIHCGVPQGSALSPLLYLLYVADLPKLLQNVHVFQYADDTAILSTGKTIQQINRSLQSAVDTFVHWCTTWALTINALKTQTIIFLPPKRRSRVHRNPRKLRITVQGTLLKPTNSVKYLGLVLDRHLTYKPHLQHICRKAYNRLNLLKRLTGTTWGLHPDTVLRTYKAFLRPVLEYGHIAWITAGPTFYNKLKILERHALRIAFRVTLPSPTRDLYAKLTFPHVLYHIERLRLNYIASRLNNHHPLLIDTMETAIDYLDVPPLPETPLSLLYSLYQLTLPANHPHSPLLETFHVNITSPSIAPSFLAQ